MRDIILIRYVIVFSTLIYSRVGFTFLSILGAGGQNERGFTCFMN